VPAIRFIPLPSLGPEAYAIIVNNFQELENLLNGKLTGDNVADWSLSAAKLAANEIQLTIDVPVITYQVSVAADTTGAKTFSSSTVLLDAATLKHLKSAKLIVDYTWAATADGTIQLYDSTAAAVRGASTAKAGGESSAWEAFTVSGLAAGNTMVIRANITLAGAAGETVRVNRAFLRLTLGVS